MQRARTIAAFSEPAQQADMARLSSAEFDAFRLGAERDAIGRELLLLVEQGSECFTLTILSNHEQSLDAIGC